MRTAQTFLKLLAARFPPPEGEHHSLTLADDGSLLLSLRQFSLDHGSTFVVVLPALPHGAAANLALDEADLDKDPDLVREIADFIAANRTGMTPEKSV